MTTDSSDNLKILTISAFYPPYNYGGYENRVRDIMDELASRGHQINVLTTRPDNMISASGLIFPYPVVRRLHGTRRVSGWIEQLTTKNSTNRMGVSLVFLRQIWCDLRDLRLIDKTIRKFQPDIIYLGNILPLSGSILPYLSRFQIPLVVDDGGKTVLLSYENRGLWYRFQAEFQPGSVFLQSLKKIFSSLIYLLSLGRMKSDWVWPDEMNVFFNSQLNYRNFFNAPVPIKNCRVIHSGLDLEQFSFKGKKHHQKVQRIIVPGRIEPDKGQIDAIRLSELLQNEGVQHSMIIVGDRWNRDYASQLEAAVHKLGHDALVQLVPMQRKEELIDLYHKADICFFPSYHKTGFSRIPLEAMSCGCVLLSYGNEGSDEIVQDGSNAFLIPEGDVNFAKETVMSLVSSPDLMAYVAQDARNYIENHHSMTAYVDQIETFLTDVLTGEADK